ncbi:hypothetical protein CIG1485E_0035 [Campylobacter iguaniorum]|uniref:Acetyltransferase n=1 Tax=Campylobacter iguaniorum TaxID=1244531 RepID=A0A076F6I2_9BACT|nr:GNAT family N-acetyltransferase [Campylobacter iguaniorum]AII13915.1 hypothetical protein CIG1485E_0035 [Campylobacter iguaniorum]
MKIEYLILKSKEEKNYYKYDIQRNFSDVYHKELKDDQWEHQFINSPYNDTALFLAKDIDNNLIVGTSLMILQKYATKEKEGNFYLFTTSMVIKEYRNRGIYVQLLKLQKEYAQKNNVDFILAFPNKLAYPCLKLFGGFKDIKKIKLIRTNLENVNLNSFESSLVIDKEMLKWRFEHKNYLFCVRDNKIIIFKKFENAYDILAVLDYINFDHNLMQANICDLSVVNILEFNAKNDNNIEVIDTINATYLPIQSDFDYSKIYINLLMSDVF